MTKRLPPYSNKQPPNMGKPHSIFFNIKKKNRDTQVFIPLEHFNKYHNGIHSIGLLLVVSLEFIFCT